MCLATLSIKAGKREHAVPLALPHTRGFISLTEQQPLETANQHAVSKGRLRWQLRARAMRSACCHLVILFTAGGAASQLAGRHVCQPAHAQTHTWGRSPEWTNPCVMFFLCLPHPRPLFPPLSIPPPSTDEKSQNNNKQTACFFVVSGSVAGGWHLLYPVVP